MFNTYNTEGEYMPPVAAAAQAKTKEFSMIILVVVSLLIITFVVWAKSTELDLVARGQGKIIPIRQIQQISHHEGGILKKLMVKEGDKVNAGEVLAVIDNIKAKARHEKSKSMYFDLEASKSRLEAQINYAKKITFSKVLNKSPQSRVDATRDFESWKNRIANEESIAQKTVDQKSAELEGQVSKLRTLQSQKKSHEEEIKRSKPHVGSVISKSEFAKMQRELSKAKSDVATTASRVKTLRAGIAQAKNQLKQVRMKHKNEASRELQNVKSKLAEAKQSYITGSDEIARTEIIAPTKGIIKEIMINTLGDTISSGEVILKLVPVDDALLFEAEIQPKDVGFIAVGNDTIVKMGAYDFTIYGGLKGKVIKISPDSFTDQKGRTFFKVMIRTDESFIMDKSLDKKMEITVGMMGQVDIKIGKRSVFDSMIKPLSRGMRNSFREK